MNPPWTYTDCTNWMWTMKGSTMRSFSDMLSLTKFRSCVNAPDSNWLYRSRKARSSFHSTLDLMSNERKAWNHSEGVCLYLSRSALDWGKTGDLPLEMSEGISCCWLMAENCYPLNDLSKFGTLSHIVVFRWFKVLAYDCLTIKLKCS